MGLTKQEKELMIESIDTMKKVQDLTNHLDKLQEYLESNISQKEKQITAVLMSQKHNDLEELGFEYDNINKILIFNF